MSADAQLPGQPVRISPAHLARRVLGLRAQALATVAACDVMLDDLGVTVPQGLQSVQPSLRPFPPNAQTSAARTTPAARAASVPWNKLTFEDFPTHTASTSDTDEERTDDGKEEDAEC